MEERVQKILSQWGIASRRQAEEMIQQSRVQVNGVLAHLGQKVDIQKDIITVDNQPVSQNKRPILVYLLLNKPLGVVSTCDDPQGRPTVLELLSEELRSGQGIHPVGRLDTDSTGALLLTNDGEMTFKLTHPRHSISKTYHVVIQGHPTTNVLEMWRNGLMLDGKKTRSAIIRVLQRFSDRTSLEIILKEGRNRQIRRVAEQLGHPVIKLHRIAIGSIQLHLPGQKVLAPGSYRFLKDFEILSLNSQLE
ncbi:pseudouridine synthase [Calothrix sp. PCC 6303]|uniref:pseudouridine synthase n=1 Tax=Calothrix sp. PCC 6303 TaxID=1170562 RepID=UPI0002A0373A|nr:pseudouridine synthase [Calothrix sp. PCC 6303]AFZ04022.1 pseudouridine synthase Rsu [Calothrix sp. PCC 6303]